MKRLAGIITAVLILYSCSERTSQREKAAPQSGGKQAEAFNQFLAKFKPLKCPLLFKGCLYNPASMVPFDSLADAPYVEGYQGLYYVGRLPETDKFIATLSVGAADCYVPVVTTYTHQGERIDSKNVAIGYCGSDCGYACEEFMRINEDYSMYTSDTITTAECDSLGNVIPSTTQHYVIYKSGRIAADGKIQLSAEIKKDL